MIQIAAFPKCYLEAIARERTMSVFDWIEMARALDAEGLEMYDGFFPSLDDDTIDHVSAAIHNAGFAMPMMCCSPDFTHPDDAIRAQAIDHLRTMIRITRRIGGEGARCRVLTGQRFPEVTRAQGIAWFVDAMDALIPVARAHDVVLALENHYKDGHWRYAEFAQKQDVFLEVLAAIPERTHFGVQYDPSNAIVAGDDPIALLRAVADRVVSMHASDRFLELGATLDDLRQADGTLGYSPKLRHGITGKGLNDYDQIFAILHAVGYDGWISIEDGMNGMDEMQASIHFLQHMRAKYFLST
jgi:sugar phosphate isomerase/epimerase